MKLKRFNLVDGTYEDERTTMEERGDGDWINIHVLRQEIQEVMFMIKNDQLERAMLTLKEMMGK